MHNIISASKFDMSFTRNFVANETKGVSCAIYQKYSSKVLAERAFEKACRNQEVHVET